METDKTRLPLEKGSDAFNDSSTSQTMDSILGTMQNQIVDLCQLLLHTSSTFQSEEWLSKLENYIDTYDRLLYQHISNQIFKLSDDEFTKLSTNLDDVVETVLIKNPKNYKKKTQTIVLKFYDHVSLAHSQFSMFTQKNKDLEGIIERKIDPALAKTTKDLTSQLVGLVAIFTALSFIVFGGITSLQSILSSVQNVNGTVMPAVIVSIAWAFCMMNLLFLFMNFILKTTKKPETSPEEKKQNAVQRYPTIFLVNFFLMAAFAVCSWIWYVEINGIGQSFYHFLISHHELSFWIGSVLIGLFIFFCGRKLKALYSNTPR